MFHEPRRADGDGDGDSAGYGDGNGTGTGYGNGNGTGTGYGNGNGAGYGAGYGNGKARANPVGELRAPLTLFTDPNVAAEFYRQLKTVEQQCGQCATVVVYLGVLVWALDTRVAVPNARGYLVLVALFPVLPSADVIRQYPQERS